jgi:hypothetical protein
MAAGVGACSTVGFTAGGGAAAGCDDDGRDGGGSGGAAAQPASTQAVNNAASGPCPPPLLQSTLPSRCPAMWLILLEAALALGLFVFIVWWTMFHRPRRKRPDSR